MFNVVFVCGEIVLLCNMWQEVFVCCDYFVLVCMVFGEMMVVCVLLFVNLKFYGILIMQIFGDGLVQMLVVQCGFDLLMWVIVKFFGDVVQMIGDDMSFVVFVNVSGYGCCVIMFDLVDKLLGQQLYQGIVLLNGVDGLFELVLQVFEYYMYYLEQFDMWLWFVVDCDCVVGMLLQKLFGDGGIVLCNVEIDIDMWECVCMFGGMLFVKELFEVELEVVFCWLFWQENVQYFELVGMCFQCLCLCEKVGVMLCMFGCEEVDSVIVECGYVEIYCEFCNQCYEFDLVDVVQLFVVFGVEIGIVFVIDQCY